jgi:hypothetical protein
MDPDDFAGVVEGFEEVPNPNYVPPELQSPGSGSEADLEETEEEEAEEQYPEEAGEQEEAEVQAVISASAASSQPHAEHVEHAHWPIRGAGAQREGSPFEPFHWESGGVPEYWWSQFQQHAREQDSPSDLTRHRTEVMEPSADEDHEDGAIFSMEETEDANMS